MVVLFLAFGGISILFPKWPHQFIIAAEDKGPLFSTSSPTLAAFYLFDKSHSNESKAMPHCGSDLHFPNSCWRRRQWHPTPVLLSGKSHGRRSLVGCSPWGRQESDTTERLHFHFSLSCIGEGNGNPLQCSCLENPRDGGA